MLFNIINHFICCRKCNSHVRICRSIIYRNSSCGSIMDRCAREGDIRYKPSFLIPFFRSQKEVFTAIFHNRRIVNIKDCATNAIYIAVAGSGYTVVEKKPSLTCLDRCCSASNLNRLPPFRDDVFPSRAYQDFQRGKYHQTVYVHCHSVLKEAQNFR